MPTSSASEELGRSVGIPIVTLAEAGKIDTDFDGADEVDPRLNLIKGYGGALVREKIVVASSRRFVVLVGEEKMVPRLGASRELSRLKWCRSECRSRWQRSKRWE